MGVNVEFLLTWLPCLDFWRKLFVKFRNSLSIFAWFVDVTGAIKPLSAVESVIAEDFHKQRSRENIALKTHVVLFAAFVSTGNVIVGIAEIYNHVISHFLYDLEGVFKESLTVSHALKIRVNAKRSHSDDWLYIAVFISEFGFCIHNTADNSAVCFNDVRKLRNKILMLSHHMDKVMLIAAGNA